MGPTHSTREVPTLALSASTWLCHAATQPLLARLDFTHQAQAKGKSCHRLVLHARMHVRVHVARRTDVRPYSYLSPLRLELPSDWGRSVPGAAGSGGFPVSGPSPGPPSRVAGTHSGSRAVAAAMAARAGIDPPIRSCDLVRGDPPRGTS